MTEFLIPTFYKGLNFGDIFSAQLYMQNKLSKGFII